MNNPIRAFPLSILCAIFWFSSNSRGVGNATIVVIVPFNLASATKSMDSWGGKTDNSISASRHSSWDEDDDGGGGGGVWNSAGPQGGSSSSFNSGGWGQSHGGKRGNMKVGTGEIRLVKRLHVSVSTSQLRAVNLVSERRWGQLD